MNAPRLSLDKEQGPRVPPELEPAPKKGLKGFLDRHHNKIWWLHSFYALGLGVLVMLFAQKGYEQARWLMLGVIGLWLLIIVFYRLFGTAGPPQTGTSVKLRIGFFVMTYVMKNLYQGMLFFLIPFYYRSTTFGTPSQWFLVLLAIVSLLATLDVVFDRYLMRYRVLSASYFFFTLFAALNLALPAFLPNLGPRASLIAATLLALVGYVSLHMRALALRRRDIRYWLAGLSGAAMALSAVVGPLVPPVPYAVLEGSGIGPGIYRGRMLTASYHAVVASSVGDLVALTTILAPGMTSLEGFKHVWRRDGREFRVVTPSEGGYSETPSAMILTSKLSRSDLPTNPVGHWSVEVLTSDDRLVGRVVCQVVE